MLKNVFIVNVFINVHICFCVCILHGSVWPTPLCLWCIGLKRSVCVCGNVRSGGQGPLLRVIMTQTVVDHPSIYSSINPSPLSVSLFPFTSVLFIPLSIFLVEYSAHSFPPKNYISSFFSSILSFLPILNSTSFPFLYLLNSSLLICLLSVKILSNSSCSSSSNFPLYFAHPLFSPVLKSPALPFFLLHFGPIFVLLHFTLTF